MKEVNHLRKVIDKLKEENDYLAFELGWAKGDYEYVTCPPDMKPLTLEDVKDFLLEDDPDTPFGGIAFAGETVRDFIEEANGWGEDITTVEQLNKNLIECGIKAIRSAKEDHNA